MSFLPRLLLQAAPLAGLFLLAAPGKSDPAPTPLGSTVFNWPDLAVKTSPKGEGRFVADAPSPTLEKFEMHISTLNPGYASHPPHHHPQEEMLLLKEGSIETSINGKKQVAGPGDLVFFASHDVHNAVNTGQVPATYYVINFYTAATGTVRGQPAAEWEPANLLHSGVIAWNSLAPVTGATDTRRVVVNSPTLTFAKLEVHATTLPAGTAPSKAHRHPWVQLIVLREGSLEITIDGVVHQASPGSVVYLASNAFQSLRNSGSGPATYFVFSVTSAATPAS